MPNVGPTELIIILGLGCSGGESSTTPGSTKRTWRARR